VYKYLLAMLLSLMITAVEAASDPTKPLFGTKKSTYSGQNQKVTLQSILKQGAKKTAIINGTLVSLGDQFAGYTVTSIEENLVKLESSEGQLTLKLFAGTVKK